MPTSVREPKIKVLNGVVHPATIAPNMPNAKQTLSRVDAYVYCVNTSFKLGLNILSHFAILQALKRALARPLFCLFYFLHRYSEQKS